MIYTARRLTSPEELHRRSRESRKEQTDKKRRNSQIPNSVCLNFLPSPGRRAQRRSKNLMWDRGGGRGEGGVVVVVLVEGDQWRLKTTGTPTHDPDEREDAYCFTRRQSCVVSRGAVVVMRLSLPDHRSPSHPISPCLPLSPPVSPDRQRSLPWTGRSGSDLMDVTFRGKWLPVCLGFKLFTCAVCVADARLIQNRRSLSGRFPRLIHSDGALVLCLPGDVYPDVPLSVSWCSLAGLI